jgi:hypothetical protein
VIGALEFPCPTISLLHVAGAGTTAGREIWMIFLPENHAAVY